MERKAMIAGNWKMNLNSKEAEELALALKKGLDVDLKHEVLLAPGFINLSIVKKIIGGLPILLAAQNMSWENKGAFTGEVSPIQLRDIGCTHVIIGHSERRHVFGETDVIVNKKIKAAIKNSLTPILCIGETLDERENQKTYRVLETQLKGAFEDLSEEQVSNIIVAYEPVWAIGTGKTATPDQAQDAHVFVRKELERLYGDDFAQSTRILYGGSVKVENIDQLMAQPDLDGALVGGESLKADKFLRVIHYQ
ncbi:MAG: triose-phosphate isomerase [Elusimicrobia bacterium]|nr:triose-phosphate isomerase [Elusimicrobiota bacterium]